MTEASKAIDYWTPLSLWTPLDKEFGFTLDSAASEENALCNRYMGPIVGGPDDNPGRTHYKQRVAEDGLRARWSGERVWCNPPYGGQEGEWVLKAYREVFLYPDPAELVVMLLPNKTDRPWFHAAIWDKDIHGPRRGVQIRFIEKRVAFEGPHNPQKRGAAFESMIVVMRGSTTS